MTFRFRNKIARKINDDLNHKNVVTTFKYSRTKRILCQIRLIQKKQLVTLTLWMPLSKFMNKLIISIQSNQSIMQAMQLMNSKCIRRLVIVDTNDKMVGIITEKDILIRIAKDPDMITHFVEQNYQKGRELYGRFAEHMLGLLPKL